MMSIGDVVPYKNTAGKIAFAKIGSFKTTLAKNKIWFRGTDVKTKARVFYPVNLSNEIKEGGQQP